MQTLEQVLLFAVVGFLAQMIDGALGMAYGVSSNTFLLSLGLPPAIASAAVHTAEVFTTAVSGLSHFRFGNVDRKLFTRLVLPGVVGGATGAYLLSSLPGAKVKPFVAIYLLFMGILILLRACKRNVLDEPVIEKLSQMKLTLLGSVGGLMDAIGGGGWGPIVTSTLVAHGNNVRTTIGSVNASEFFVTGAEAVTFFLTIGLADWKVIVGLMLGGVVAAPLAAYACKKIPARILMITVGLLIILLSVRTFVLIFV